MRILAALISWVCIFLAAPVSSAGFNENYQIFVGDSNEDGLKDLFIREKPRIVILHGEIAVPIVLQPSVKDSLLVNNGSGSFSLQSGLSSEERAEYASWQISDIEYRLRDVNLDGSLDMETVNLGTVIPNSFDQIVFAGAVASESPLQVSPIDEKYDNYFRDLFRGLQNPNYFEENAPRRVVGVEPATRTYAASVFDASSLEALAFAVNYCEATYGNMECGISTTDPLDCWQYLELLDENGESLGWDWVNVCIAAEVHVYAYEQGSVTIELDYSIFDEDAVETAEILHRLNASCPAFGEEAALLEILGRVFGDTTFLDSLGPLVDTPNSFDHPPFPGDSLFDTEDSTYHHYDVLTKVCSYGESGCDAQTVTNSVLRYFTYPSQGLAPTYTDVDGRSLSVYIALLPSDWDNAESYTVWGGLITQRFVEQAPYSGGIQNITEPVHIVYPGTISRVAVEQVDGVYILTHGIGINRAFCTLMPQSRPVHILMAYMNDTAGPKAFETLDQQMLNYYREH